MKLILAFDLGTGGNKASLFDENGACLGSAFISYDTFYPGTGWHEQRPLDWWAAVAESVRKLMGMNICAPKDVKCISISGHSLGAVPLDASGNLLRDKTPIWSDTRASKQTEKFFSSIDRTDWYLTTGNGFPAECYTLFKAMWYRDNEPEMFAKTDLILGTKDYINYRLTGVKTTDYSYASGTGIYNLMSWSYEPRFIKAGGLSENLFPEPDASARVIGGLTKDAAGELGLSPSTPVVCGGVDNSCMALGAGNTADGRVYTSLGSSSWIAVSSAKPVLDAKAKPYVFTHVLPGMFTSAVSIFAAGSSFRWLKENLCRDLVIRAEKEGRDVYDIMTELAAASPIGARGLMFNPSLAGGTAQEPNLIMRGGFSGLDLKHNQGDVIRAVLEGVALNLGAVLKVLKTFCTLDEDMVMVGGGSRSGLWRKIFANVYDMNIVKSGIDQQAASLGAAALGAIALGIWKDASIIDSLHGAVEIEKPSPLESQKYGSLLTLFEETRKAQAAFADAAAGLDFLTE